MRKLIVVGIIVSLVAGALVLIGALGFLTHEVTKDDRCSPSQVTATPAFIENSESLTIKGDKATLEQLQNAEIIVSVASDNKLPARAAEIAIMTAIQESELINIPYGYPGSSSLGLFQQIKAWGPRKIRMNPPQSSQMFYTGGRAGQRGLEDVVGWRLLTRGQAAQEVQGSAFPDAYATHEAEAKDIVAAILGNLSVVQTSQECDDDGDPIEEMVQAALSRVGQSADAIAGSEGSFRMGTYNVKGSNHTGHESAMQRAVPQSTLIKDLKLGVVGVQELRPDQRTRLMELLGDSYAIFPEMEVYGAKQTSANSIIVDMTQFKYISDRSTPMPFYFGGQELDIPLVELEHLETGLEITVINTHDPAKPIYNRLRYLNAEAHAELVNRLAAQSKTVFFTGDFNSGFKVRDDGNTTYQNDRLNLTWCIMTRSGEQINGYDDALGRTGCPIETTEDLGEGPVDHIYVPRDGVTTVDHTIVREGTASDHPLVYVDIAVDGAEPSEDGEAMESAEFISWAADEAGFNLPDTLSGLKNFDGTPEEGVSAELLTPDTELQRGDILFRNLDEDPEPEEAGIELGTVGAGSELRLATYNITVKRQFANYSLAVENITSNYKMDIVGAQELIGDSYRLVQQRVKAAGYGIYPDYAPGLRSVRHSLSGRSIIYNKNRFVLDESRTTMFRHPRYPDDRAARVGSEEVLAGQANVPVAYFVDKLTEQPLIVVNFHNVAFARYAKLRYESNLILVEQMKQLQAENPGVPVFLTGDFNEGTGVRRSGTAPNVTYQERSENLLYCMFASNGLMADTGAESEGRKTSCPNSSIGGVDYIYASPNVEVKGGSSKVISEAQAGTDHPVVYVDVEVPSLINNDSQFETSVVALFGEEVAVNAINTRKIVGVLRLTVASDNVLTGILAEGWVFPLKAGTYTYNVNSYGPRDLGGDDYHNGTDFGTAGATPPLFAMHGGVIIEWGYSGAWGNRLVVETGVAVPGMEGETYKYLYGHLSTYASGLSNGDTVEAGELVGYVGNTGNSLGEHLHLTICTNMECTSGNAAGSTDPIPFLSAVGIRL